jgi:hypothetical protein
MAAPTNVYQTYSLRGSAEDVDSKIYNMDPEETAFASSLEGFKVDARVHQWQEDSFASANKDNAMTEGDDFSGQAQSPTLMLQNSVQTFRKDVVTSGLANAIKKYGRQSEQDYLLGKATVELRKDVEAAMLSNNGAVAGTAGVSGTPSKMAGLEVFANVNVSHGAGGSTAAISNATLPTTAPTDGTTRTLTEAIFLAPIRTMWENGGKPKVCYLTMAQKAVVNTFAGIAQRYVESKPKDMASIVGVVDIYVWETGPIAFVPLYSDRLRSRTLFVTDGESIKRGFIRPVSKKQIGTTGDNVKTMLVTDVTLKVTNRKGVLKIADLS